MSLVSENGRDNTICTCTVFKPSILYVKCRGLMLRCYMVLIVLVGNIAGVSMLM